MNSAMILLALPLLLLVENPGINGQTQDGVLKGLVCNKNTLQITCPKDDLIKIHSAFFGRFDSTTCAHGRSARSLNNVTCSHTYAKLIMQENCDGKNRCRVYAHSSVFGDPCFGTSKYLQVEYFCTDEWDPTVSKLVEEVKNLKEHEEKSAASIALLKKRINRNRDDMQTAKTMNEIDGVLKGLVCNKNTLQITCPNDDLIKIHSAFYGRFDSTTCAKGRPPKSLINVTCAHAYAKLIMQENCDGKNRCSVYAHSSVFGDPCFGTSKYLHVEYFCQGTEEWDPTVSELVGEVKKLKVKEEQSATSSA